jgi:ElaB/YqjD/DUF883 family membrane-anchored ribosome-binding protein
MMNTETLTPHGSIASSKQALVKDLKNVIGDTGELLGNVAASASESVQAARTRLEGSLSQAKTSVCEIGMAVGDKACRASHATGEFIKANPWKTLGIAVAAGLLLGVSLRRRPPAP